MHAFVSTEYLRTRQKPTQEHSKTQKGQSQAVEHKKLPVVKVLCCYLLLATAQEGGVHQHQTTTKWRDS